MAEIELTENHKVYKNGAVYDKSIGRIVGHRRDLATVNTQITPANSADMLAMRARRKHEVITAAANAAVQDGTYAAKYGNEAFLAAIADSMMITATTPDAPAAVRAAQWLERASGYGDAPAVTVHNGDGQGDDLVMIVMRRRLLAGDVVDGEIAE